MLKAVLFLACGAGAIVLVKSYDDDSPPPQPPTLPPLCPKYEEYYNCTGGCVLKRCSELGYPLDCNKKCTPGCVCKGGYLRRDDGKCVPINDCPSCGGDANAKQGCGSNCNKMCSDVGKPPSLCPPACRFNACDCRPGFWYDSTKKKCVKAVECSTPPNCPKNEVYNNCTGGCSVKRCSELGFPLDCKKCSPGCICKGGYLRRDDGKCVPTNDCPSCGGDDNAQQGCGSHCGRTCADVGKPPPKSCPISCLFNGCECRPDFWYDRNTKKCVKAGECPQVCKENEEYSPCSNGGCGPKNCSQINDPRICVDPRICIKGCVCRDGYLRTDNGTCVLKNECPRSPTTCPKGEVYNNCSNCAPRKCSEIGFPLGCLNGEKCTPGCVCKDDNVRRDDGKCVPINDCPSCGGDENAQQGCSNYCGKTCADIGKKPGACALFCMYNGCQCRKGFWYDTNQKKCVKAGDCTQLCKVNEVYSNCSNGGCGPKNCSQINDPEICVDPANGYCSKGCICAKGYLRAKNGTCIPKDQCPGNPTTCPKGEVYNNCSNCAPRKCSEIGFPLGCLNGEKCTPGCVCKDDNVRSDDGKCVSINDCPSCGGDENAQQGCGNYCGKTCADIGKKPGICPLFCMYNGCQCRKGFWYDTNQKKCVKAGDCTQPCKVNEVYSNCINGGCGPKNCSQINDPEICVDPAYGYCIKGCICAEGYLRAKNGTCIPKDQCPVLPPKCPRNEIYNNCSGGCVPRKCSEIGFPLGCLQGEKCTPGCVCKDGNVRRDDGKCVPIPDCPSCGGDDNAEQGCGNHCGETCSDIGKPPKPCPLFCIFNGCNCRKGFWYDGNQKKCVKAEDCTPTCPVNEEYTSCINGGCSARNCSQYGKPVLCVKINPKYCIKGCVCVKGYLRDSKGLCVPEDQCKPKCDKPNEVFDSCSRQCPPRKCNVNNALIKCRAPPKPGDPDCIAECRCIDDYYRNATGTCVPKKQCEKPITCGKNQHYNACPMTCPPQECGVNPALILCLPNPKYGDPRCRPGCVCDDGYLRDDSKICVPKDKCPTCTGPNEYYETCIQGCSNQTCGSIGHVYHCPLQKECKAGCRCNPGYYRNRNNVCVTEKECKTLPNQYCNKKYEYWDKCYYNCGGNQSCEDIGKSWSCPAKVKCQAGCRCQKGYWRDRFGNCIPESKCPKVCGQNEEWQSCFTGCSNRSCSELGRRARFCPPTIEGQCRSECRCKYGYFRNNKGVCVPQSQCPKQCGKNEHWEECNVLCGGDGSCNDIKQKYHCPKNYRCSTGCRCDIGYWRDKNGVCIPETQCPNHCPKNEYFEPCIQDCRNQSCNLLGKPAGSCPGRLVGQCNSGCRCLPGHHRDSDNVCIPDRECPRCPGRNEIWVKCIKDCSNQTCDEIGKVIQCPNQPAGQCRSGCRCQEGLYRNNKNECVPKESCPPICKKNEEYSPCANGGCGPKNCSQINDPRICVDPRICIKGCVCKQGYLRAENGTCVPKDKCPPKCGENEHYESCITTCGSQNCSDAGKSWNCPNLPEGKCFSSGCVCNYGYLRNASNVCIRQEKCPTPSCPPGQVWDWCPTVKCEGDYCMKTRDSPRSCPTGIVCSPPRCVCGYNSKIDRRTGKCIPIPKCPPFKCGNNEEYQACSTNCPGERCSDLYNKRVCPKFKIGVVVNCAPQCKCIKGFLRDENKNCIPACECPVTAPTKNS